MSETHRQVLANVDRQLEQCQAGQKPVAHMLVMPASAAPASPWPEKAVDPRALSPLGPSRGSLIRGGKQTAKQWFVQWQQKQVKQIPRASWPKPCDPTEIICASERRGLIHVLWGPAGGVRAFKTSVDFCIDAARALATHDADDKAMDWVYQQAYDAAWRAGTLPMMGLIAGKPTNVEQEQIGRVLVWRSTDDVISLLRKYLAEVLPPPGNRRASLAASSESGRNDVEDEPKFWDWPLYPLQHPAFVSHSCSELIFRPGQTMPVYDFSVRAWVLRYYSTAEDRAILCRHFPAHDSWHPSWATIEAELIVNGHAKSDLVKMNAPTLLRLLVTHRSRGSHSVAPAGTAEAGGGTGGEAGKGTAGETGREERNAEGFVVKPKDSAAYVSFTDVLTKYCPKRLAITEKQLRTLLDGQTEHIRQWRPREYRRSVHLGDWHAYVQKMNSEDGWPPDDEVTSRIAEASARRRAGQ